MLPSASPCRSVVRPCTVVRFKHVFEGVRHVSPLCCAHNDPRSRACFHAQTEEKRGAKASPRGDGKDAKPEHTQPDKPGADAKEEDCEAEGPGAQGGGDDGEAGWESCV